MDTSIISALAALLGAIIGGGTSVLAAWIAQRHHARAEWFRQEHLEREKFYQAFIENAVECYSDAVQHDRPDMPGLVALYAKIDVMLVRSSDPVIEAAEEIRTKILDTYADPNKDFPEISEMIRSKTVNVFTAFSMACRKELEELRMGSS